MFGLWNKKAAEPRKGDLYEKSDMAAWAETLNPLRGLTIDRAARIYDNARIGAYADLQWLYNEIEAADPTLLTCAERRSTAILETDWTIRQVDADHARGFDEKLAVDQAAFLTMAFGDADRGNLADATEHLSSAWFRGYAHIRPLYAADMSSLQGFALLDNWNFNRDVYDGTWWWNPDAASGGGANCQQIPAGELVSVVRPRHIDYPALDIYIRRALGDKKYGVFLERYGVPPVLIIMPPDIDKGEEPAYLAAAEAAARAASGALPNGSSVEYATEARGVNPFTDFLRRQQELIVLMSTGGLLTSLSSPTGIGQGASNAHEQTWRTIIRRDCRVIAAAMNRIPVDALLNARFPGRPHLAYFDFADPQPTADDIFETATKANTAGYRIKRDDLEEKTGYALIDIPAATATTAPGALLPTGPAAAAAVPGTTETTTPLPAALAAGEPVADTALNGAQIQSIVSVIKEAASGQLPLGSVMPTLQAAFPSIPDATLRAIVEPLSGFVAAVDPAANKADPAPARKTTPVEAALAAIESGADPEAALDAYDQAAAAALQNGAAVLAERMDAEMNAAAQAGKEGTPEP